MRLFIGIKTKCDDHLITLQDKLRRMGDGRFTYPDNLHITLKFLGEVPRGDTQLIKAAMAKIDARPFALECLGVCAFGKSGIVAAGVGGDMASLNALHVSLEDALARRGFDRERRPYRPHITLARKYRPNPGADIAAIPFRPCAFEVREIVLFESKRVDGRLRYEPVWAKGLKGGC